MILYIIMFCNLLFHGKSAFSETSTLAPRSNIQLEAFYDLIKAPEANKTIQEILERINSNWDVFSKTYSRITGYSLPSDFHDKWKSHIRTFHISLSKDTTELFQLNPRDLFCMMNFQFYSMLDKDERISVFSHELAHVMNNLAERPRFIKIITELAFPHKTRLKEEEMADRVGQWIAAVAGAEPQAFARAFQKTEVFAENYRNLFPCEAVKQEHAVHPPTSERIALARSQESLFQKSL